MPSVAYPASFGYQTKQIDISQVSGGGGDRTWHVMVDRYLVAIASEVSGEIRIHPTGKTELTGDDLIALQEIIQGL